MRRTSGSLVRVAATVAVAMLCAASAQAGSTDYLLELGGVDGESTDDKHKNQIEILSYSWGATRASGDLALTGQTGQSARESGEMGGTMDINIGIGELQEAAGKDMVLKGSKIGENSPAAARLPGKRTPPTVTLKRGTSAVAAGGVNVAAGDVNGDGRAAAKKPKTTQKMLVPGSSRPTSGSAVGGAVGNYANEGSEDAASGQATGKRQHKPLRVRAYYDAGTARLAAPLAKGSLTVRGKFPQCAVGTRYPSITLGGAGMRYTLKDAIITSCGTASGEALPMEEVSFNYGKIKT